MKRIIIIIGFIQAFTFSACQYQTNEQTVEEPLIEVEHTEENIISLNPEQVKALDILFGTVEQKALQDILKVNGELRVPNQNKAIANTLYPGTIEQIFVQSGNFVNKGQPIVSVTNADYVKMQEDYLTLGTQSAFAETEYQRQKELYNGNAGALKNLQQAETEFRSLNTRKSSIARQLQMMGINPSKISNENLVTHLRVLAPVSGFVSNISVQIGSYADTNTPIAEIIDNRKIHLDLHVYEKDLASFKAGQNIDFFLTNNSKEKFTAEVYSTGSSFEENSKTIIVHAQVTGDKTGLIDGMNITAHVGFNDSMVDAVPREAVASHEGLQYIFILEDKAENEHADPLKTKAFYFRRVPVILGKTDIGYTQITPMEEIRKNSKVVIKGAFFLMAKFTDAGEDHGH